VGPSGDGEPVGRGASGADPKGWDPSEAMDATDAQPSRVSGVRATIVFARQQSDRPHWPLGLCIAWVMSQDLAQGVKLFIRRRLGLQYDRDQWASARTKLMNRLGEGCIQAFGLQRSEGKRVEISAVEWMDLWIMQRGAYEEVRRADRSLAYHDVRIAAAQMRELWRAKTSPTTVESPEREVAVQIGSKPERQQVGQTSAVSAEVQPPDRGAEPEAGPETPAAKRARDRFEAERACEQTLREVMTAAPHVPIPKSELRKRFSNLSGRAFDRAFTQAAVNAGSSAWTSGGRRPKRS
jgi:hypothetical protein